MQNDSRTIQQEGRAGDLSEKGGGGPRKLEKGGARYLEAPPEIPAGSRTIPEYPHYAVTNDGTIYSCRAAAGKFVPWRPMSPVWIGNYLVVGLRRSGCKQKLFGIHRLVLMGFVGPQLEGIDGCHNDGDTENNNLWNLRWDTCKGNLSDRAKHGTLLIGTKNHQSKLDDEKVREIRKLCASGKPKKAVARMFAVSDTLVRFIFQRRSWKHVA